MVDTKCIFPNGKYKRKQSASNSEAMHEDESLLRQPHRISCAGFKEVKKAYENGTDEVRRLLMQECSLIFECSVCRNMFRSLANFISHKRHYCKTTAYNFHSFQDRDTSMLIQTVECSDPLLVKSRSTGSSPIPNNKSSNRDLSTVIERLKRVEVSSDCKQNKTSVLTNKADLSSAEPKAPDPVLELERVSTTTHAVYQTLKSKNDSDSMKTELDEVHNLLEEQNILLGPDGKAVVCSLSSTAKSGKKFGDSKCITIESMKAISCEVCKMPFQTEKTLKMHIERNHTSTTYVFQCPTCSLTFLQPAAVIRHLANEHKKPLRRIRKMRDTILKKRIQIGDVQVKGLCREVKGLQMTDTKDMSNHQNGRSISSCSYCFKNFERRAALATHLINCVARRTSLKNVEASKEVNARREQKVEAKTQSQTSNQTLECNNQSDRNPYNQIEERKEIKLDIKQEPQEDLNSEHDSLNINKLFANLEKQTFGNGLHTVCLENLQMMVDLKETSGDEQERNAKGVDNNENDSSIDLTHKKISNEKDSVSRGKPIKKESAKRFRIVSASKQLTCRCKICSKQFNALSNLRRHISMFHYRSKRFGCNLCDYRAFRRYDIVNHLTFVHRMTGERELMAVEYVTVHEMKYSKDDVEGDIVVVDDDNRNEHELMEKEPQTRAPESTSKIYEKRGKGKKLILKTKKESLKTVKIDSIDLKEKSHVKVVRRKIKKSLEMQIEGKKRPIRNRIKTVNNDFVYDMISIKEEPKQTSRFGGKRSNTDCSDKQDCRNFELTPPPIKITPYRLRTEPLIPGDKSSVKGAFANVFRNVINEALAAPSTLPELPTERPQMRSRLISSSRSDSNAIPIIETSGLEAAGLKSTFFDDSFLEKFAKKSNPSFKMKPLLAMQHSPLSSILQKFDASQQISTKSTQNKILQTPPEINKSPTTNSNTSLSKTFTQPNLKEKDATPNGKQIFATSSPPATPKKRITLMERLAENRAKREDSIIRNVLDN